MVWSILLGAVAGWGAGLAEAQLRPLIERHLPGTKPTPVEMRGMALSLCLLVAAIVASVTGGGSAVWLCLGAVLGVLGPRLMAKFRAMRAPDYD